LNPEAADPKLTPAKAEFEEWFQREHLVERIAVSGTTTMNITDRPYVK
jgi:hypothetical protein